MDVLLLFNYKRSFHDTPLSFWFTGYLLIAFYFYLMPARPSDKEAGRHKIVNWRTHILISFSKVEKANIWVISCSKIRGNRHKNCWKKSKIIKIGRTGSTVQKGHFLKAVEARKSRRYPSYKTKKRKECCEFKDTAKLKPVQS